MSKLPDGFMTFDDLKNEVDASYTPDQRKEYDDDDSDAETQITLAELVYQMRTQAGISQSELARLI